MARNAEDIDLEKPDLGIPEVDPNVKISLEEPEEGDDKDDRDEPSQAAAGGERQRDPATGKWTQKKRERAENRKGEAAWRTEKADYDRRFSQMQAESDRRFQQMQQELDRARAAPAPGQHADPFESKLSDLGKQIDAELKLINADENYSYARYNELRRQEIRTIAAQASAEAARANAGQQSQQQAHPYAHRLPFIESEFPWTMEPRFNELARKAQALKQYLVNVEGRPDTLDVDREALTTTVARFGAQYGLQAPAAAPSERTRQMYQGPSSRQGPMRGDQPLVNEMELPRTLANGHGLSAAALRAALRGTGD